VLRDNEGEKSASTENLQLCTTKEPRNLNNCRIQTADFELPSRFCEHLIQEVAGFVAKYLCWPGNNSDIFLVLYWERKFYFDLMGTFVDQSQEGNKATSVTKPNILLHQNAEGIVLSTILFLLFVAISSCDFERRVGWKVYSQALRILSI
jgi:hypothetical protein